MGNPERRNEKLELAFEVLKMTAAVGLIAASLVAPNMAKLLPVLLEDPKRRRAYSVNRTVERLRRRGLMTLIRRNGRSFYALTPAGEAALRRYELRHVSIPRPKRWDQKWRVVIFDVREERKTRRNAIRSALQNLGFVRLQDSVWIHPFPCDEILELIRTAHGVRHDAFCLVTERFPQDAHLLEEFDLRG